MATEATLRIGGEWERYYKQKCDRIKITYGDAGVDIDAMFKRASTIAKFDAELYHEIAATATEAQALCKVKDP